MAQNATTTSSCVWSAAPTDPIFAKYLALQAGVDGPTGSLSNNEPSFTLGAVEPPGGVDVLAAVNADPVCSQGTNGPTAVAVGKTNAGGTTSTVVYVGVEPMNMGSTAQQFVNGIVQTYAGLP